jgi:hypothetical protein
MFNLNIFNKYLHLNLIQAVYKHIYILYIEFRQLRQICL